MKYQVRVIILCLAYAIPLLASRKPEPLAPAIGKAKKTISITNATADPIQIIFTYGLYHIQTRQNLKNDNDPIKKESPLNQAAYHITLLPHKTTALPATNENIATLKRIMQQTKNFSCTGYIPPKQTKSNEKPKQYIHENVNLGITQLPMNKKEKQDFALRIKEVLDIKTTNTYTMHVQIEKKRR